MRYAILASLLLHVLLLWPAPLRPPAQEARALLQATVRSPQPEPVPELPKPVPPRAVPPVPTPAQVPPMPLAQPLEVPRQASVPVPSATASASAAPSVSASPIPAPPAGAPATATAGTSLTPNAASGESLDGLRGYRLAVASQARRFKRYPAEAKASGWTGSTEVRLDVGAEGQPRPAAVARSSGHEALDRAALAMIDAGAARARLPDSLRGRSFTVTLPVVFNLDEE
ncbi:MAG: TonB family protein [Rhodocyclales bacterium]|nr:TonB family protein [Rhodocyclales bacterium]